MPRLRNQHGVVVSVSAETAARLGSEWQPVTAAKRQAAADAKPAESPQQSKSRPSR